MSALLLIHKTDDGQVTNLRFAFRDGEMSAAIEQIADYMHAAGLGESLYENVAADRLAIILAQRVQIKELKAEVALWVSPAVRELVT